MGAVVKFLPEKQDFLFNKSEDASRTSAINSFFTDFSTCLQGSVQEKYFVNI